MRKTRLQRRKLELIASKLKRKIIYLIGCFILLLIAFNILWFTFQIIASVGDSYLRDQHLLMQT